MKPRDVESLVTVTRIADAGDIGILLSLSRPDLSSNRYQETIICIRGNDVQPFTDGDEDSSPVLSPDGERLAFLRRHEGLRQAHVIEVHTGVVTALAVAPCGVEELTWAPDGRSLIVSARRPDAAADQNPLDASPRRIRPAKWRLNGVGRIFDRPRMLAVLDLSGDLRWLDIPRAEWSSPFFTSEGTLHAIADAHDSSDHDNRRDLYRVEEGNVVPLTDGRAPVEVLGAAAFSDGAIALAFRYMGANGRAYAGTNAGIGILREGVLTPLSDPRTSDIGADGVLSIVSADLVATSRSRGTTTLVRVSERGDIETVLGGEISASAHAAVGGRIFAACATVESSAVLFEIDPVTRQVSAGLPLATSHRVHRPRELLFPTRDGSGIHGWSVVPEGAGPHPVIVLVHGGPFAQHGPALFDEAQVLAEAGFAVLLCNPRGSAGYGEAHARAVIGRLGREDTADVLDFLEAALASDSRLDADRLGIMGGSYGGFLSAWVLGHDNRFRGGLLERGWFDPDLMVGTSDIGSFYVDAYMGETPEDRARTRPIDFAHLVTCPVLVMHSDDDLRCPISQAETYVAARRRRGLPTEFVVFPGENHELSRSGAPRHRVERFEIIIDWWQRVFAGAVAAAPATPEKGWR